MPVEILWNSELLSAYAKLKPKPFMIVGLVKRDKEKEVAICERFEVRIAGWDWVVQLLKDNWPAITFWPFSNCAFVVATKQEQIHKNNKFFIMAGFGLIGFGTKTIIMPQIR